MHNNNLLRIGYVLVKNLISVITMQYAYFTMLTNDNFLPGLVALSKSIRLTKTQYPLGVIVSENVTRSTIARLKHLCDITIIGRNIKNPFRGHNASWFNSEFFKLNIWSDVLSFPIAVFDLLEGT